MHDLVTDKDRKGTQHVEMIYTEGLKLQQLYWPNAGMTSFGEQAATCQRTGRAIRSPIAISSLLFLPELQTKL